LVDCISTALTKIDFDAFMKSKKFPWTLVHGDFYPGNVFEQFCPEKKTHLGSILLDWEWVGIGSGPQDCGQYMISNSDPITRRKLERDLVVAYYAELKKGLSEDVPSEEEVWEEYLHGGAERWIWLIPLLVSICPPELSQYFCDQVSAFVQDHFPGVEGAARIGMPRV